MTVVGAVMLTFHSHCLATGVDETAVLNRCANAASVWSSERQGVAFEDIVPGQAVALCEAAVEIVPNNGDAWAFLARAYRKSGRNAKAVGAGDKAIELGSVDGLWERGVVLQHGIGGVTSHREAAKWYREAAEHGHAVAQYNLGWLHRNGEGVVRDDHEAVRWWRSAAERGYPDAQFRLGSSYYEGEGVRRNPAEAARWHRRAAQTSGTRAIADLPFLEMLADRHDHVRQRAVDAIGGLGQAIKALTGLLADDDAEVRNKVAETLGRLGGSRAVNSLIGALEDEDSGVRNEVVRSLGRLGDPRAVDPLIGLLGDRSWVVRESTAEALGALGDPRAADALAKALSDDDSDVRKEAAEALGRLGDPRAVEPILALLADGDYVDDWAVEALAGLTNRQTIAPLAALADVSVRRWAISWTDDYVALLLQLSEQALAALEDPPSVDSLVELLSDDNFFLREQSALALGALGDPKAVEPLTTTLDDDEPDVAFAAAWALQQLGDPRAVEPFVKVLESDGVELGLFAMAFRALHQLDPYRLDPGAAERLMSQAFGWVPSDDLDGLQITKALGAFGAWGDRHAVEPLIEWLGDKDAFVRSKAAEALGMLGDPGAVDPLVARLVDENTSVRRKAAEALGVIGDPRAVEPLIERLVDEDWGVRSKAAKVLGMLGNPGAVDPLVARLVDEDTSVRRKAAEALGVIGDPRAIEPLVALVVDGDFVDDAAKEALGTLPSGRTIELLRTRLADRDPKVRARIAEALGELGDARAVEALVATLNDDDESVRWDVLWSLEKLLGHPRVFEVLMARLATGDDDVRAQSAQMLGYLEDVRSVGALVAALEDTHSEVRANAAEALGRLGDVGLRDSLLAAMNDDEAVVRASAAEALGEVGGVRAVEPLIVSLDDIHYEVRSSAAWALGKVGDVRAVESLIAVFTDDHAEVRSSAAWALGKLRDPRSVEPLLERLADDSAFVRWRVVNALAAVRDRRALEPLMHLLVDGASSDSVYQSVYDVRSAAAEALGTLGDRRAVAPLAMLVDDDDLVHHEAIQALGEIGGPSAIELLVNLVLRQGSGAPSSEDGSVDYKARSNAWAAASVLGRVPSAIKSLLALLSDKDYEVRRLAMRALVDLNAFSDEGVRGTVAKRFTAPTLLPAVSSVSEYHRGILFCVQTVAERAAYGPRLELLQAVWRWRYMETGIGAGEVAADMRELRSSRSDHQDLGPYTLLLAAILAAGDERYAESLDWAQRGLARADEREVAVRIALAVVEAEALVALDRASEALKALEAVESAMKRSRLTPNRARLLDFLPKVEVLTTKAFVLLKLGFGREALEAGYEAESVLDSRRLWERIDDERYDRLMGARIAPLQLRALEMESRPYERRAKRYFRDYSPRGIVEEYGHVAVVVKRDVEDALRSGDYESYLKAQRSAETLLLESLVQPDAIRFADAERRSAYEQLVSLQRAVGALQNEMGRSNQVSETLNEVRDPAGELRKKKAELARFVTRLKRRHPAIAVRWAKAPTDVAQLQERLNETTGIVQYLLLDRESYAFVIRRDDIAIERLRIDDRDVGLSCPEAASEPTCFQFRRSVNRYRALLRSTRGDAMERAEELAALGETFSELLLAPLRKHIGGLEHLVLVPNNILHRLPWAALPWEGGYLVEHKTLSVLPATSMFGALLAPPEGAPAGVLGLGNPIPVKGSWSDLQGAESEMKLLERHFPHVSPKRKRILIGPVASLDAVVGHDFRGYVLHFAAHAQSGRPDRTRLLLSGGDLTYDHILGLNVRNAPSVVLSACETGLGELLSGDQVYSLADAFLMAEARSVVYSLWLVNDGSTRNLMEEYYKHFGNAGGNSTALAEAQRAMIRSGYSPGHWAGFLVSEWSR